MKSDKGVEILTVRQIIAHLQTLDQDAAVALHLDTVYCRALVCTAVRQEDLVPQVVIGHLNNKPIVVLDSDYYTF